MQWGNCDDRGGGQSGGGGRLGQIGLALKTALKKALGPMRVLSTTCPGEERRLAELHVRSGAQLGVISVGTGRDFIRTLGGSSDVETAASAIGSGRSQRIDAGL